MEEEICVSYSTLNDADVSHIDKDIVEATRNFLSRLNENISTVIIVDEMDIFIDLERNGHHAQINFDDAGLYSYIIYDLDLSGDLLVGNIFNNKNLKKYFFE